MFFRTALRRWVKSSRKLLPNSIALRSGIFQAEFGYTPNARSFSLPSCQNRIHQYLRPSGKTHRYRPSPSWNFLTEVFFGHLAFRTSVFFSKLEGIVVFFRV